MDKALPVVDKYFLTGQSGQQLLPILGLNAPSPFGIAPAAATTVNQK